ncbi:MAG: putative metalloprotease CJM1_0395 family protein, partial [Bradymonadia bacterium]
MSISNITQAQTAYGAPDTNQNQPTLKEADGVLLVSNGRTEHPLQNEHCKPCYTVFQDIQTQAEKGGPDSQDLLKRAQAQMESLQSAQINELSAKSGTVLTYAAPNTEASQVNLSTDARMRAANVARLQPEKPVLVDTTPKAQPPAPAAESSGQRESTGEMPTTDGAPNTAAARSESSSETHGPGDGHGHGSGDEAKTPTSGHPKGDHDLSEADLEEIRDLQKRDAEVRAHEHAHKNAAGSHGGAISLSYRQGPDGKRYAVEGEVPVDLSAVSDDPEATVAKMQQIQRAALAPAEPSSADRRVAAKAASKAAKARKEIAEEAIQKENPLKSKSKSNKAEDTGDEASTSEVSTEQTTERSEATDTQGTQPKVEPKASNQASEVSERAVLAQN